MSHTPGPWYVGDGKADYGYAIATINPNARVNDKIVIKGDCIPDAKATMVDANLIAASPDLLEALEDLMTQISCVVTGESCIRFDRALDEARAAIAKAKGE